MRVGCKVVFGCLARIQLLQLLRCITCSRHGDFILVVESTWREDTKSLIGAVEK